NLLPNGYEPQHLKPEASTGRTGTRTAPPAATPGPPPMPPRRAIAPPSRTAGFDAIPALPPPRRHGPPPRPQIHPIPDVRASAPQQPAQPARGWWARLIDWMKNPA
ncbi:MAG: hypothetical protein J2P18_17310, partial [Nocardia sp.]|nr:hypothetical protein [Nocardia sp.]